jgi:hypothetical protein
LGVFQGILKIYGFLEDFPLPMYNLPGILGMFYPFPLFWFQLCWRKQYRHLYFGEFGCIFVL